MKVEIKYICEICRKEYENELEANYVKINVRKNK